MLIRFKYAADDRSAIFDHQPTARVHTLRGEAFVDQQHVRITAGPYSTFVS
jgi:hypothetical protein